VFCLLLGFPFLDARCVHISAGDAHWESLVRAAFKHRIEFVLGDLDKLQLSDARMSMLFAGWSALWIYTSTITGATSVRFVPDKLPAATALWNIPPPDPRHGKRQ
jgi:hypothetical protein